MISRVLNSKTKTVGFAALLLGISTLISRLLGLVRDRLLAGRFGAGEELDIYFASFRIPDFVYGVLIVGGISAAFLPLFSEYFQEEKKEEENKWPQKALEFVNNVLNCFFILLVVVCSFLAFIVPYIIKFIIPGFSPENRELAISLTRIMFLSPILFGLSSIFSGILHYFNRFLAYSLAPIFYNLGIIFGIIFFAPFFGIFGLAMGVILGAFFHLIIQIPPALKLGYKYKPIFNFNYPGIKRVFKLMAPRVLGTTAYHINLIVITAIASTLTAGSIAIFNFSNNLHYFPVGIIGISFAVSSFPAFSRSWAQAKKDEFLKTFSSVIRQILFFITPICFLMFLLRAQIVRLFLGTGEFGWLETRLTAASLGVLCLAILANSIIPTVSRSFFALCDTRTPVIISLTAIAFNIFFSFLFVHLLISSSLFKNFWQVILKLEDIKNIQIIGLSLAFSFALLIQVFLLLFFLYKKIGDFRFKEIILSFIKFFVSALVMGFFVYFTRQTSALFVDMNKFLGIFIQTFFSLLAGLLVYSFMAFLLKCPEIKTIKRFLLKKFKPSEVIEEDERIGPENI